MLPTVDETLSKLLEVKIFLKFDANSGFWQIPLAKKSKHMTTFILPVSRFALINYRLGFVWHPNIFNVGCRASCSVSQNIGILRYLLKELKLTQTKF